MKTTKVHLFLLLILSLLLSSCSKVTVSTADNYETVTFPDGSFAYLNKNSSVEFDEDFDDRKVKHHGEVFYEVRQGNNPFVVETGQGIVTVLGTEFNVKTNEKDIEVEVESGTVELKTSKLAKNINKGQKAVAKEAKKDFKIVKAEFKHNKWIQDLKRAFKKLGKDIGRESKKAGQEVKKGLKNLIK